MLDRAFHWLFPAQVVAVVVEHADVAGREVALEVVLLVVRVVACVEFNHWFGWS